MMVTEEGRGGGALVRILTIAPHLSPEIQSIVVCPSSGGAFIRQLEKAGIPYRAMPLHSLSKQMGRLLRYSITFIRELWILTRIIKNDNPDIVHCNGSWQIKGVLAGAIARVPTIWHMNDSQQPLPVRYLFRALSHLCDGYIYASNRTKSYYQDISPAIVSRPDAIISPPVDIPTVESDNIFENYPGTNIVTVGYINPNKGFDLFIRIAHEMQKGNSTPFNWHIVGPALKTQSQYFRKLKELVTSLKLTNVHFWGFRKDVAEIVSSADVYLCTSFYESSPIALWEAMSCGTPVISTDVGDVKDLCQKEKCGICIFDRRPKSFVNAIHTLLEEPQLRSRNINNALKAIEKYFSPKTIKDQYLEFYLSMCK